jgi:hypothetical protein
VIGTRLSQINVENVSESGKKENKSEDSMAFSSHSSFSGESKDESDAEVEKEQSELMD